MNPFVASNAMVCSWGEKERLIEGKPQLQKLSRLNILGRSQSSVLYETHISGILKSIPLGAPL